MLIKLLHDVECILLTIFWSIVWLILLIVIIIIGLNRVESLTISYINSIIAIWNLKVKLEKDEVEKR